MTFITAWACKIIVLFLNKCLYRMSTWISGCVKIAATTITQNVLFAYTLIRPMRRRERERDRERESIPFFFYSSNLGCRNWTKLIDNIAPQNLYVFYLIIFIFISKYYVCSNNTLFKIVLKMNIKLLKIYIFLIVFIYKLKFSCFINQTKERIQFYN